MVGVDFVAGQSVDPTLYDTFLPDKGVSLLNRETTETLILDPLFTPRRTQDDFCVETKHRLFCAETLVDTRDVALPLRPCWTAILRSKN